MKTAGFCKSLLGNFKGQNPDRFYFDVVRTHHEVVDHVWSILHPSTRIMHGNGNDNDNSHRSIHGSSSPRSSQRSNRTHHHHHHRTSAGSHTPSSSNSPLPNSSSSTTSPQPPEGEGSEPSPPLPPPSRNMHRSSGNSMQRSRSVQDSGLRPPNFQHLPPLPPYSQRSCSSDILMRANSSQRSHLRTIPTHGPHMASTASFNPYLSPSISETGSDGEEDIYANGGSECYVTMSSHSEATYLPSTQSDPGTMGRGYRPNRNVPPVPTSDTSTAPSSSDMYMTSAESECSGASYRVNSPPPLYREVDEEHSVPLNFDNMATASRTTDSEDPNSAAISLVSPIIPIAGAESSGNAVFNFDAAAVLTRTRELEGELQRLRTAMTCRLCRQNPIGATFCPCGHTVCCYQCAQRMQSCWECDELITSVQRMLLSR